ncbi:cell death regulator Aven [Rana temporaria]|uniref:cell death regulator Aven n=1 Tax=Rana temporaria TaxID=8407 RepID=UPI001AAD2334|nr:cell death regulator Aven [Rana temporaria]
MERGRSRHRRGGGGRRPYRGRGSGGDREHVYRGHRGPAREHTGIPEPRNQDVENGGETAEVSEERTGGFSKRKLLSNWDRYEAAEKQEAAGGSEVLRRGEEYSVLLSSAGDSYTQFRLSEEKEWGSGTGETPGCADYKVLLTALQTLPLHITLNIEEELVQEGLPQELPHFTTMGAQPPPPRATPSSQPPLPGATPSSQPPLPGATPSSQPPLPGATPSSQPPLPGATPSSQPTTSGASPPHQTLDQELDFLLGLEAPVLEGKAESPVLDPEPKEPETPTMIDNVEEEAAKAVTAEDLEDWLDAMIA